MINDKTELMENSPVRQAILKLALPTMLSMAVALIYNLTDTFFIGKLNDPNLVAALSIVMPVFMGIQAFGSIFSNGASSYISRKLGAKEGEEAKRTSSVAIYSGLFIGIIITVLLLIFRQPFLTIIGTSTGTFQPTSEYFTIISSFSILFIVQITLSGLIRSEGATDKAMKGMILGIGLNIILDPIFIFTFNMGVTGAAWATVMGTIAGSLFYILHLTSSKTLLSISIRDFKPSKRIFAETFKIGVPSALSHIVMSFSMVLVNILASSYGDHVVAGNGIHMRISSMSFMLMMGLAQGFQPFVGYNYGAKKYDRLREGFKITLLYSTLLGLFFTVLFLLFGEEIIGLFIKDKATIEAGSAILKAFTIAIPFIGIQMTMMVAFQSTGKAMKAMVVSLGRQCLIYIPALFTLNSLYGFKGFIFAQPIGDILTAAVAVLMSLSFFKEMNLLQEEQTNEKLINKAMLVVE